MHISLLMTTRKVADQDKASISTAQRMLKLSGIMRNFFSVDVRSIYAVPQLKEEQDQKQAFAIWD